MNNFDLILMTNNLSDAINECAQIVIDSELHDLPLGARQWIWFCLGEKGQKGGPISAGHSMRYNLAKKSVQKVIPFWLNYYPTADKIDEILHVADDAINDRISQIQAYDLFNQYLFFAQNLKSEGDHARISANGVCFAAVEALYTALYDENFDPFNIDPTLSNSSMDGFDYDASFSASLVYAGGGVSDKHSNPIKRREYWLWWLKDAINSVIKPR